VSKVLWIGDAGCHTGFGIVAHAIGERLVSNHGHDVHVLATNYLGDYWETNLKLYRPNTRVTMDTYGQSRFIEMLANVEPDVVVVLNDPYVIVKFLFANKYDPEKILLQYRPLLTYIPLDGHNQPPGWGVLGKVTNRVAMSRFGQSHMPEAKLVYHGVDTQNYWPVSSQRPIKTSAGAVLKTKADCREAFGYPRDAFLVLRVDRNSGRKDFPATWKSLVPVMQRHTDIVTHFHCQGQNDLHGVDLVAMFSRDPETKDRFFLPEFKDTFVGWTTQDMNALINGSDLFVTNSRGEGFGLTIAEALACGVPVVAQNVTAIPEVVGPGGILLEPQREVTVPSGQDLWLSDVGAFTEAIEHLYVAGGVRRKLGLAGWEHVTKSFSWDFAAARFDEYITALANGASDTGEEVLAHGAATADSRES
jgi:glycosyltransferase involved in cell wall biosynthesis